VVSDIVTDCLLKGSALALTLEQSEDRGRL